MKSVTQRNQPNEEEVTWGNLQDKAQSREDICATIGVDCFVYSFLDVVLHYFPSLAGPMYCKLLVPSIRIIF